MILPTACSLNDPEPIPLNTDEVAVTLCFSSYAMEPMTKTPTAISELSNRLDVYIVSENDVKAFHQTKTEDVDFGTVYTTLDKTVTYTIYAVAHKGSGPATLSEDVLSFQDDKITETFYFARTFSPEGISTMECSMNRIVGQFRFVIQDEFPQEVAKLRFTFHDTGLGYHVNGYTTNIGDKVSVINNPSHANDGSTTCKIYCLADSETTTIDVTVEALDADDAVVESRDFADVPIKAGYVTSFTGTFFVTTALSFNFFSGDSWEDFISMEF